MCVCVGGGAGGVSLNLSASSSSRNMSRACEGYALPCFYPGLSSWELWSSNAVLKSSSREIHVCDQAESGLHQPMTVCVYLGAGIRRTVKSKSSASPFKRVYHML